VRGPTTALLVLALAIAAVVALVATGVVDVGVGRGAGRGEGEGIAPPDPTAPGAPEPARLAPGPGGAKPRRDGAEGSRATEDVLPPVAVGTAPLGAVIRGHVTSGSLGPPVEGATVRLTRPDSLCFYLRAKREGRSTWSRGAYTSRTTWL
jgi:hypothetical protein